MVVKRKNIKTSCSENSEEEYYCEEEECQREEEEGRHYLASQEEAEEMCRAFTLLDVDGDGVLDPKELDQLFISWGRLPFEEMTQVEPYIHAAKGSCGGTEGMNFEGFKAYICKQLLDTNNEDELRKAFQAFDSSPPTGKVNVVEFRHYLKHEGMKLTDDEIDFLFKEENYWMLEEKNMLGYEELIKKMLNRPCDIKFLQC